jgi:hypothetical protein
VVEARVLTKDEEINAVQSPGYHFGWAKSSTTQGLPRTGCAIGPPSCTIPSLVVYRAIVSGGENVHVVNVLNNDAGGIQKTTPQTNETTPDAAVP